MIRNTGKALTLRQLEDRLPLRCKLSSAKLTIEIQELSKKGFNFSVLVQLAGMLYEEYRAKKAVQLDWSLQCTDPILDCACVRKLIDLGLTSLLNEVHQKAAAAAVQTPEDFQAFSSQLTTWLKKDCHTQNRTYWIRETLRDCLSVTDLSDSLIYSTTTLRSVIVVGSRSTTRKGTDVIVRSKRQIA